MLDKTTKRLFSAVLIIAALKLTLACLGCDGPIPADSDSDCPSVDLPHPGGVATPAPQPEPVPGPVTDDPGHGTLIPAPAGCTVGEVEDWGDDASGYRIAGTATGFAVAYDSDVTHVRMVAPDGTPTSPDEVFPPTGNVGSPEVGGSRDGYIVVTGVSGSAGPGVYVMGQDGAIKASALSQIPDNVTVVQIIGGTLDNPNTLVWQTWGDGVNSNNCVMAGDLSDTGAVWGKRELACQKLADGWWEQLTGAARGKTSTAFTLTIGHSDPSYGDYNAAEVWVYIPGYGANVVNLGYASGYHAFARVLRILSTTDGYAVLWERAVDPDGDGESVRTVYLAMISDDGRLQQMVELPKGTIDLAWNGKDFGLLGWDNTTAKYWFKLVAANGEVKQTLTVGPGAPVSWESPKIAASGSNFAAVWTDFNETALKFAPIACQ